MNGDGTLEEACLFFLHRPVDCYPTLYGANLWEPIPIPHGRSRCLPAPALGPNTLEGKSREDLCYGLR
jgi:hypothetical protein